MCNRLKVFLEKTMLAQGNTTDIGDNARADRIGKGARYRARGQIRLALTGNCYTIPPS